MDFSLNLNGRLMGLKEPKVMGIVNITPDSFYAPSRMQSEKDLRERVKQVTKEGCDIIDVGAYSSRPGALDVSEAEEMNRLKWGLKIIKEENPQIPISVDTFRATVAQMVVDDFGVEIINDISGGEMDENMFDVVAQTHVAYIMMHMKGTPQNMQDSPHYEHLETELFTYFSKKINELQQKGVCDIILDPGFGFSKTLEHNYELLAHLEDFKQFELPILVGVSRKSMIYKLLETSPENSLGGTIALNTIALLKGANILRVHDVQACVEAVKIVSKMWEKEKL